MEQALQKVRALLRAKLGRCARCMRLSLKLAFLGGAAAVIVDSLWPHSGIAILITSVALSLAALQGSGGGAGRSDGGLGGMGSAYRRVLGSRASEGKNGTIGTASGFRRGGDGTSATRPHVFT